MARWQISRRQERRNQSERGHPSPRNPANEPLREAQRYQFRIVCVTSSSPPSPTSCNGDVLFAVMHVGDGIPEGRHGQRDRAEVIAGGLVVDWGARRMRSRTAGLMAIRCHGTSTSRPRGRSSLSASSETFREMPYPGTSISVTSANSLGKRHAMRPERRANGSSRSRCRTARLRITS